MRLGKRKKWLGLTVLVLLVAGALLVDWRLVTRAMTYPEAPIMTVDWYRPQAVVQGQSGAPLPQATEPPTEPFSTALQKVSAYAETHNSTGLLVMHRGEIVWEDYWQGHDATSQFNAMSMSKTLVGLLVGMAIAEGAINSLDDFAVDYIPEWAGSDRASITIRDLLYMQSGLRNERRTNVPTSDLVQMYIGSNVFRVALNIPSVAPSGETFDYNNVNTQILALILQRATSMPYADYVSTRLWQPLGASDASVWLDRPRGNAKTFCCFFGDTHDWARMGQMLTSDPIEPTFGAHIWVKARTADYPNVDQAATEPFLAGDAFYLDGRDLQRVYVIPSHELVIVRMGEFPESWNDSVIPNTLLEALGRG